MSIQYFNRQEEQAREAKRESETVKKNNIEKGVKLTKRTTEPLVRFAPGTRLLTARRRATTK